MISLPESAAAYEHQKRFLKTEGVVFKKEKIDLSKHGFSVSPNEPHQEKKTKKQRGPEEARPR